MKIGGALAAVAIALGWLHLQTPHLVDRDSYYHARMAQLLPERGLSREFPWAQQSIWKDRFSDKDLLFHAWLAPFCRPGREVGGAKVATWLLGIGVAAAFAWLLVRLDIKYPWLWVALLPALGNHFLWRLQPARSQILSILLLLIGLNFLMRARWRALAVVGFISSWSYAAPHLLIAFALIDALSRWAIEKKFEWRGLAWAAGGVVAGLLFHPYFPNDLKLWWVQNVRVLVQAWNLGGDVGMRLGDEFDPVHPRSLIVSSTLVMVCFLGSFLASGIGTVSDRSKRLLAIMTGGFLLYCLSGRFIEYFAPLALLAAASVFSDLWRPQMRLAIVGALAAVLLAFLSLSNARTAVRNYRAPDLDQACAWTKANIPPGETIVHLDWGDFVQLFHFDPTHHYLVGLDPMFMFVANASNARMIEDMRLGRRPVDPAALAKAFNARWLVARARVRGAVEAAGLTPEYEDAGAAVYLLR